jgi:hypothetical protein
MFNCDYTHVNEHTCRLAEKARNRAADNGRPFIVPEAVFENMDGLSNAEKYQATHFSIQDVGFVYLEPNINDLLAYYRGNSMQMAIEEMSPDEITIAVATEDKLEIPDGGHYTRRDYKPVYRYHGNNAVNAAQLLGGTNPIEMVTSYEEIASIKQDDIDYHYYENLQGRPDMRVFTGAVDNFINRPFLNRLDVFIFVRSPAASFGVSLFQKVR